MQLEFFANIIIIFKSFARPHQDYGEIICERAYNTSFYQNIELIQYNAALAITGTIRGTSREKLNFVSAVMILKHLLTTYFPALPMQTKE